ncbi:hypothetical protein CCP3SC1AL1_70022 [Gammaproteobacteria bacterium]
MSNSLLLPVAAGVVVIILLWWFFGSSSGDGKPKSKEEITKLLESQGYKIKEVDFDDGVYEVDAYKDGKKFEIKVDPTGKILKVEEDD